ncbi:MAG: PriCT-2 domain-containing protein [Moraxellaceae bacterium]|nr:PriCT-2 domain-containing protein [Moraxellaceae bacterium]
MRDISLETIIVALTYIDAHDRDIWLKVGNALKTEFGEIAFAVFDNWSQSADNYDAKGR